MVPTPPRLTGDALDLERDLGRRQTAVAPPVHRRRAGVGRLPRELEAEPLDAGTAGDGGAALALRARGPGPARCEARGRCRSRRSARAPAEPPRGRRRTRRGRHRCARPPASVRSARAAGSSVPASAELPNRLRPKRAPSSSAKSIRTRSRGGATLRIAGPGAEHPERGHRRRARRRAALRPAPSRDVSRGRAPALASRAGSGAQRLPASSVSTRRRRARRAARGAGRGRPPFGGPAEPSRAAVGATGERGELGRSAITRLGIDRRRRGVIRFAKPRAPGAAPARGSGRRRRRA